MYATAGLACCTTVLVTRNSSKTGLIRQRVIARINHYRTQHGLNNGWTVQAISLADSLIAGRPGRRGFPPVLRSLVKVFVEEAYREFYLAPPPTRQGTPRKRGNPHRPTASRRRAKKRRYAKR